jgi:hypothetical protein
VLASLTAQIGNNGGDAAADQFPLKSSEMLRMFLEEHCGKLGNKRWTGVPLLQDYVRAFPLTVIILTYP